MFDGEYILLSLPKLNWITTVITTATSMYLEAIVDTIYYGIASSKYQYLTGRLAAVCGLANPTRRVERPNK
jgi:hypothetical protein